MQNDKSYGYKIANVAQDIDLTDTKRNNTEDVSCIVGIMVLFAERNNPMFPLKIL